MFAFEALHVCSLLFGRGDPRPIAVPPALREQNCNPEPSGIAWSGALETLRAATKKR